MTNETMTRTSAATFRAMVHFAADLMPAMHSEGRATIILNVYREAKRRGIHREQEAMRYLRELEDYANYLNRNDS